MPGKIATIGSRAQVFHGTAMKTSGGLRRSELKKNREGRIVSRKASASASRNRNLGRHVGDLTPLLRSGHVGRSGTVRRRRRTKA